MRHIFTQQLDAYPAFDLFSVECGSKLKLDSHLQKNFYLLQ